jgi:hypothetical protein
MGIPKFKFNQPLKKDLTQLELTEEDLVSGDFPADEIFRLKINDVVHGYFWQYDLKDYVQQDTSFQENTFIQKHGEEEWVNLFDHPFFQRRRPQIVTKIESNSHAQEYYILDQGQKMGPYSIEEIQEQVRSKKAILTDMISLDDGQNWGKIYDLIEFDRRNEAQAYLPHTPEQDVLSQSDPEINSKINRKRTDATEFIARLAYLGKNASPIFDESESDQQNSSSNIFDKKSVWPVVVLVVVFLGISSILMITTDQKSTKLTGNKNVQRDLRNSSRVKKVKAENTAKASSRNLKASNARKAQQRQAARRNKIRKSTPFKRSKTYQKAREARNKRFLEIKNDKDEDDNFYDDGSDPVEQDPVRRTLSKDTINPSEDDYEMPYEEEQFDDEEKDELIEEEPIDAESGY